MTPLLRHLLYPALLPLAFFTVAATPVTWLGCRNRGLLAIVIVLLSTAAAVWTTAAGARRQVQGDPHFRLWLLSTLVLLLPFVGLLILA